MHILEQTKVQLTAEDLRGRRRHQAIKDMEVRSSGVHLSGVLKVVAETSGLLKGTSAPTDFENDYPTIMALGVAWEEFAISFYPDSVWQPGEMERDGIFGTPDGLSQQPVDLFEEFKFTTKKLQPIENCWWYLRQGMGYCALSRSNGLNINHVRYHICWAHGDYQREHFPIYTRTLVQFEDVEIEKFWRNVVLKNKDKAKSE